MHACCSIEVCYTIKIYIQNKQKKEIDDTRYSSSFVTFYNKMFFYLHRLSVVDSLVVVEKLCFQLGRVLVVKSGRCSAVKVRANVWTFHRDSYREIAFEARRIRL